MQLQRTVILPSISTIKGNKNKRYKLLWCSNEQFLANFSANAKKVDWFLNFYDWGNASVLKIAKNGNFQPLFHSVSVEKGNFWPSEFCLKRSLVLSFWGLGVKLAWKYHLEGAKIVILAPLQGEKFLIFHIWLKKSLLLLSWYQGAKLAWKLSLRGGQNGKNFDFGRFSYTVLYKVAENHKSHFVALFLPLSMAVFWFPEP